MEHADIMEVLAPVEMGRGTWKWMLEEGNFGYGLVPWVSNVTYRDELGYYGHLSDTIDMPIYTPALVRWWSPINSSIYTISDTEIPYVAVEIDTAFGFITVDAFGTLEMNGLDGMSYENWETLTTSGLAALPIWCVTPIAQEEYECWMNEFKTFWQRFPETDNIPFIHSEMEHNYVINDANEEIECPSQTWFPDYTVPLREEPPDCSCGIEDDIDLLIKRLYSGSYFPRDRIYSEDNFFDVWDWAFERYLNAIKAINHTVNENIHETEKFICLSSWAWSQSPFSVTSGSSDYHHIAERELSTPSMSSHQGEYPTLPPLKPSLRSQVADDSGTGSTEATRQLTRARREARMHKRSAKARKVRPTPSLASIIRVNTYEKDKVLSAPTHATSARTQLVNTGAIADKKVSDEIGRKVSDLSDRRVSALLASRVEKLRETILNRDKNALSGYDNPVDDSFAFGSLSEWPDGYLSRRSDGFDGPE